MTRASNRQPSDSSEPDAVSSAHRWKIYETGEPIGEWDPALHAEWREKWAPPCPDGNPQRLRRALGFRERNVGELELRVPLRGGEHGACQVIVDERDDEIRVRVLICYDEDDEAAPGDREYIDCPVRLWLERSVGDRAVIDHDSDDELPLYTPRYVNNVPRPDHGYRPAGRPRQRH